MSQLDQLPAGAIVRARPWDVIGAGLAAPMVLWGFLGWFGTAGDSGGGIPGFYSGTGAAGIGLVLAAAALTVSLLLAGRPHEKASPPAGVFLATAAAVIILGGMVAKPDTATIQAGSVAGLLTALTQAVVLVRGWLQGSQKSVKAANVRTLNERQANADLFAAGQQRGYAAPTGYPFPSNGYPAGYSPVPAGYSPVPAGYASGPGYPPGAGGYPSGGGYPPGPGGGASGWPPAAGYPPGQAGGYPPPVPRYPQVQTPTYPGGRPAGPPPGFSGGYPAGPARGYPPGPPAGPARGYPSDPPPGSTGGNPPASPSDDPGRTSGR